MYIFYFYIILVWNVYCYFIIKAQLKRKKKQTFIIRKGRKLYCNFDIW